MAIDFKFDGPIPGENFTSDTRNYPWHRPPEFSNPDQVVEWLSKMLTKKEGAFFVLTMLGFGMPVATIVSTILMKGISQGKWSIDTALLSAGPISHMIVLIAKKENMEFTLGTDDDYVLPTDSFFKEIRKINKPEEKYAGLKKELGKYNVPEQSIQDVSMVEMPKTGFMSNPMAGAPSSMEEVM